jgi:hypothetical protein
MNARKSVAWMGTVALLFGGFLGAFPMKAADNSDSEQVSKLLSDAKAMAFQVKEDAQTMAGYAQTTVSWQTHVATVDKIREHVNALGQQVTKLKAARDTGSPWQKTAIDRIDPYLDEMGGYTTAIIEHINKNPKLLFTQQYRDYLETNADYASDLAAMIADFVDYGRTKQKLESLGDKLEISSR